MYRVIVIDDEPLARQLILTFLARHPEFSVVAECADGFDAFKKIQELNPDLIFLDVQMPKLSGFEMLELLDQPPSVIFTTAFDQYAMAAFEAHAIDYLLKPISPDRFEKALGKWKARIPQSGLAGELPALMESQEAGYSQRIVLKDRNSIRIIPAGSIHYIEASDDYVRIVCEEGSFLKKSTLSRIEDSLDPKQFVRVHRSYLIPVTQIAKIEPYEKESHIARLHCGAKALVSKAGMSRLKEVLGW